MLLFILVIPVVLANILDLPPSFLDSIVLLLIFTAYILTFKLGRPEGYAAHWFKSHFTLKHFRPGHQELPLPIDLPAEAVPTRADLAATELQLLDYGFLFIAPGQALPVESVLPERLQECRAMLESGEPISMLHYVFDKTISQK